MAFQYGALFDMDGVIVDNAEYHALAFAAWCRERNILFDREYFDRHIFGKQNRDIFKHYLGHNLTPKELEVLDKHKEELYRRLYADHVEPVQGFCEFAADLKSKGFGLAVATSGPPENVNFVIQRLGAEGLFDAVITSKEVKNGKPDPEVFLVSAEKLDIPTERCAVFEDSVAGAKAAVTSGAILIGVSTGHQQLDHAALMISDFTKISPEDVIGLIDAR